MKRSTACPILVATTKLLQLGMGAAAASLQQTVLAPAAVAATVFSLRYSASRDALLAFAPSGVYTVSGGTLTLLRANPAGRKGAKPFAAAVEPR